MSHEQIPQTVSTSHAYYSITTFPTRQFITDSMKAKLYFITEQPDIGSEAKRHERLKSQRCTPKISFKVSVAKTTVVSERVGACDVMEVD